MDSVKIVEHGEIARLSVSGKFSFNLRHKFTDAYKTLLESANIRVFEIDMSNVEYMDSSALGMLLVLRERAREHNKRVNLVNYHGVTQKILKIAKFDTLFS